MKPKKGTNLDERLNGLYTKDHPDFENILSNQEECAEALKLERKEMGWSPVSTCYEDFYEDLKILPGTIITKGKNIQAEDADETYLIGYCGLEKNNKTYTFPFFAEAGTFGLLYLSRIKERSITGNKNTYKFDIYSTEEINKEFEKVGISFSCEGDPRGDTNLLTFSLDWDC